jgi:hypothetical protein
MLVINNITAINESSRLNDFRQSSSPAKSPKPLTGIIIIDSLDSKKHYVYLVTKYDLVYITITLIMTRLASLLELNQNQFTIELH